MKGLNIGQYYKIKISPADILTLWIRLKNFRKLDFGVWSQIFLQEKSIAFE